MLDRKWVLEHLDDVLTARPGEAPVDGETLRALAARRVGLLQQIEALRHERKQTSQQIGRLRREGQDTSAIQAQVRGIGDRIAELEAQLRITEQELDDLLLRIPNVPLDDVPDGADDTDNVEVRRWGAIPEPADWRRPHWEIGEALGIMDFERAGRVAGARFAYMIGIGARLELSLANWMVRRHAEAGYTEMIPPYLVRDQALIGTGQLPKFADDLFRTTDDRYLIPTAEVPVTNFFADEILGPDALPQRFVAFSPCFRAEAGAAGRDTRGIIRVHQFHKVELVHFERPEHSARALEELTTQAEALLQALELPYRVVALCRGDLGFSAAKTYDLEVWLPGQQRWLEISSCSTFTDFQARRAGIRFRSERQARPQFVHTLNGSGLAIGRTIVALLENGLQADGSVVLPPVLREWVGVDRITVTA